ncbi:protein-tyrosine-phosphatase [Chryseobacterium soli]|uniref:arsenate-mycothiol transferase ArsC n=1 Tax=Chryseobacterium soli TaxID=445961 RepID=UPI002954311C|nr:protein-tyrosine-phosphatase [Chryseobacterium soli]MDV7696036.1 protein-tyrosine-phosphatase [Chryseobacterium soli]
MNLKLLQTIESLKNYEISAERKSMLRPLADSIRERIQIGKAVRLNFICTHNSRRSHLTQVWAQAMSFYYNIREIACYSGGTEGTAVYPKVIETIYKQGFGIQKIADTQNPVYSIKYNKNSHPVIAFSKKYDDEFNPANGFIAVMTCSEADSGCPFIADADLRISLPFEDPKISDGTLEQDQVYQETSLQIGAEMRYVFSQINTK